MPAVVEVEETSRAIRSDRAGEALSWLRISRGRHEPRLNGLLAEPIFRALHGEVGFAELLAAIGLPSLEDLSGDMPI